MHTASILVVDDDLGTVETFAYILRLRGYAVGAAHTGQEGLGRAREHSWDLLLTDLSLPDFSGIDLLRYLHHEGIRIPAIIMTAFGTIESAIEATKLGAMEYLEKPLFDDDVVGAVRRVLTAPTSAASVRAIDSAAMVMSVLTCADDTPRRRCMQQASGALLDGGASHVSHPRPFGEIWRRGRALAERFVGFCTRNVLRLCGSG